jgi:hypothetical protein
MCITRLTNQFTRFAIAAAIIQWGLSTVATTEAWTLEPAGDGYVRIVARHSGKAMDVEFASADDGARVIQYTPHSGANQQWLLRQICRWQVNRHPDPDRCEKRSPGYWRSP